MIYQGEFELNNNNNDSNTVYNKLYPKDVHALLFLVIKQQLKVPKLTSYISLYNELQFSEHLY